jgi:hypothetical protein
VRLLALSLTATLVLTAIGVSQNLVAWQCSREDTCLHEYSFLRFLEDDAAFFGPAGRQVALAAAVPVLLIGLLWRLSRGTQRRYEEFGEDSGGSEREQEVSVPPLGGAVFANRDFWQVPNVVGRLTSLHATVALCMVTMSTAYPFTGKEALAPGRQDWVWAGRTLAVVAAALAGLAVILVASPWVNRHVELWRPRPGSGESPASWSWRVSWALPVAAGLLVALAAFYAGRWGVKRGGNQLPGFDGAVDVLFGTQVLLVGVLLLTSTALLWNGKTEQEAPWPGPAFAGYGCLVFAVVGVVLAGAFAAGLTFRVADALGKPVIRHANERLYQAQSPPPTTTGIKETQLTVDGAYLWYARTFAIALILAGLAALLAWLSRWIGRKASALEDGVRRQYAGEPGPPPEQDPERVKQIARARAWASLSERASSFIGRGLILVLALGLVLYARYHGLPRSVDLGDPRVGAALTVMGLVAGALLFTGRRGGGSQPNRLRLGGLVAVALALTLAAGQQVPAPAKLHGFQRGLLSFLTSLGTWGIGLFAFALVLLGQYAYRNPGLRRTVGILWDLGTFWPRAAHPFAPPCYCERTVPEFKHRIERLTKQGGVVELSAHSQGSVVAAATILRLDEKTRKRIFLITYGCPLQRLYARVFPDYFGRQVLAYLRELLSVEDSYRWRNCYRLTDPLGGPVFVSLRGALKSDQPPQDRVDLHLLDPRFHKDRGELGYPPTHGHSDYLRDPGYHQVVHQADKDLARLLTHPEPEPEPLASD